jgi:hypothetical protein
MPRALAPILLVTSAVFAALVVVLYRSLPPHAGTLTAVAPETTVIGGYHIHSNRSDGSGSVDAIARAAHDAGLSFIILTDHGDGTAVPLAPSYRSGVLTIDAVEISTNGGHLVALGLPDASPYPMGGEPADVIDDVHRRGGFAIVAHPDSSKPDLQWRAWTAPFDGIEWMNADSESAWRTKHSSDLVVTAARVLMRPPETLASMFVRPVATLRRWDTLLRRRPVPSLAGLDAHANVAGWPRYVDLFRTIAQVVQLPAPLTGQAGPDAAAVIAALRAGRSYSLVRAFASPAFLQFSATHDGVASHLGDWLPSTGSVTWDAAVDGAPNAHLMLIENGREVAGGRGRLSYTAPATPGAFRVEVTYSGFAMPWMVSNSIYVGDPPPPRRSDEAAAPVVAPVDLLSSSHWRVEHDPASTGTLDPDTGGLRFQFALGGGRPASQYAAAVVPVDLDGSFDRVQLVAHASAPMRVSVQVRLPGAGGGQRWRRSAYVDASTGTVVLPLSTFVSADRPTSQQPIASAIREVLVVIDTVNTAPGTHGTVWITGVGLGRAQPR